MTKKRFEFSYSTQIVNLVSEISKVIGKLEGISPAQPQLKLRKQNKIKTIHASLAIEGNTLSEEQITAILEGKRISGHKLEIKEFQNALKVYDQFSRLNPFSLKDFLTSHKWMLQDLKPDAGKFRASAVGVLKGSKVSHVASLAHLVHELMADLFDFLKKEKKYLY